MLKQVLLRGGIPLLIFSIIVFFLNQDNQVENARSTAISGLIVVIVCVASLIYDLDQWSLLKRSIVHFLIMLVTIYPILLLSGWFALDSIGSYFLILLYFLGVGLVMWAVMLGIVTLLGKRT